MYNDNIGDVPSKKDEDGKEVGNCGQAVAPVGCVAVAVAQIMAYHKKPAKFLGRDMHWDEMTAYPTIYDGRMTDRAKDDIKYLLERLGWGDLLKMDYTCVSSGASIDDAVNTFRILGYKNAKKEKYNAYVTIKNLDNKRPVYINGKRYDVKKGHAWMVDGYRMKTYICHEYSWDYCKNVEYDEGEKIKDEIFLHNNFGWGKGNTLWLKEGIFDTTDLKLSKNYNFGENNYIIIDIY